MLYIFAVISSIYSLHCFCLLLNGHNMAVTSSVSTPHFRKKGGSTFTGEGKVLPENPARCLLHALDINMTCKLTLVA